MVYVVTSGLAEAELLAEIALTNRLCACANILPGMQSMYHWEGKVEKASECVLLLKTEMEKYDTLEKLLVQNHSYDTPAIFCFEAERVEPKFGVWLKNELR